jgi:hypothetical protein
VPRPRRRGPGWEWDRRSCVYGPKCLLCDSAPPPPPSPLPPHSQGHRQALCLLHLHDLGLTTCSRPVASVPMFRQQGKGYPGWPRAQPRLLCEARMIQAWPLPWPYPCLPDVGPSHTSPRSMELLQEPCLPYSHLVLGFSFPVSLPSLLCFLAVGPLASFTLSGSQFSHLRNGAQL